MLTNYIKIAFRTMLRNKSYSLINILGLSTGVACCLLLTLYIQEEMSYDKHHNDRENIYRIVSYLKGEGLRNLGTVSPPIAPVLKAEIPEIVSAARLVNPPGVVENLIKYEGNVFYEKGGYLADSTIFDILSYNFIEGSPANALTLPNSVVVTRAMAEKLFGNQPALNKVISIAQGYKASDFRITGVVEALGRSFMEPNFFVSMNSDSDWANYLRSDNANQWAGQNFVPAFVKLQPNHSVSAVEKKMNEVLEKHGAEDMKALGLYKTLGLEPVQDIYLKSDIGQKPRVKYLYVIGSIAAFILLIGCINFMNLSTAKATQRANEVGLRKVMGAIRQSLVKQFLGEAIVVVVIAVLLSIVLIQLTLPWFNALTGKAIAMGGARTFSLAVAVIAFICVTSLLAGSYPALYLSSFQPADVLKGKTLVSSSSGWLRKGLVVFQFTIAIVLASGMLIISQQLNFIQSKELGYDAKAKIALPLRTLAAKQNYEQLKKELTKESFIQNVAGTEYIPGAQIWSDMSFYPQGGNMQTAVMIRRNTIDFGYIEMMGFKLIAGRSFNSNRESESNGKVILNRTASKRLGFEPELAVNQPLHFEWQGKKFDFEVIGVVEDFHQTSPKEEFYPTLFEMGSAEANYGHIVLAINQKDFNSSVNAIEKTWKKTVNDTPFEYSFIDENIAKQFNDDKQVASIIFSFTIIAMFISCMGLYGLSTFMAERKYKEIGVRKVLGATVRQIVTLMSTEFVRLVFIAFVISIPIAWYIMSEWLQTFANRITIRIEIFLYAGLGAVTVALLTVSFESIRAAATNPAKSLKSE